MGKFFKRNKGATMIEYVLLIGLLSLGAIAVLTSLGLNITDMFTKANSAMPK